MSFLHKNIVNLYITYKSDTESKDLNKYFALSSSLFRAVEVTKNADPDKCKYGSYSMRLDSRLQFSWTDGSERINVIIFRVDNSSSVHVDGKNKNILFLGEEPTQGLDSVTTTVESKYPINFTESGKRFVLSLH